MGSAAAPVALAMLLALAGCASADHEPTPQPGADAEPQPWAKTLFLKSGFAMREQAPTSSQPSRVPSTPIVNGYANEDIRDFQADLAHPLLNITHARLTVFYEAEGPTLDPFPDQANPTQARQFAFWLGSRDVYPNYESTFGNTVLLPNQVYQATTEFDLPEGGWIVPRDEPLQVLVATLAVNDARYAINFLVDAVPTPSRLELEGFVGSLAVPATLSVRSATFTISGNAGMFTGATPSQVESRLRTMIDVGNQTYLELRVLFQSNAGGKSDLDFTVYAPDGSTASVSTTPFQNETVRMFMPLLGALGPGAYTAEVTAYSGADTRFELRVLDDVPR